MFVVFGCDFVTWILLFIVGILVTCGLGLVVVAVDG